MKKDKWISVDKASDLMLEHHPSVVEVERIDFRLRGINKFGASVFSVRIFDGSEHKLAKHEMVLDWRKNDR